jgi:DNA-binding Xre family transcriptional regulator
MPAKRKDRTHMLRLKVKEVAKEKGLSMAKLGRMADLNQRTIQSIYNDPYRDVAYSTLVKLARALNVTVDDLTEEVPDDSPTQ